MIDARVLPDAQAAAQAAAALIAAVARAAVNARGQALIAVSGGRTPAAMLRALAHEDMPWSAVHLFQVDERVAPLNHADRNLTAITTNLITALPLLPVKLHPMPVGVDDLEAATEDYADTLQQAGGTPPILDVVHLGLGADGHTASLVPGDPAVDITDRDVAISGVYQGRRRMTLTFPALDRARRIVWLVTGADKHAMLQRLLAVDRAIPAGRVAQGNAVVIADQAAAEGRPTYQTRTAVGS